MTLAQEQNVFAQDPPSQDEQPQQHNDEWPQELSEDVGTSVNPLTAPGFQSPYKNHHYVPARPPARARIHLLRMRPHRLVHRTPRLPRLPASLAANITFLAIFGLFFLTHAFLGIHYRIYSYMLAVLFGVALECIGYGGRIGMYYDVFAEKNFVLYLVGLTIGPAFFSAAVYLCIGRIIRVYEASEGALTFLKPKTITLGFICCDMISLVLQAAGGGLASAAKTEGARQKGVNVMISGLSTQVVATTVFCCVCMHLMWNVKQGRPEMVNRESEAFRRTSRFRMFLVAIGVATITILIRCIFRVAELSKGFKSKLANDETMFEVWDTTMMIICVAALMAAHPGLTLGHARWKEGAMQHPFWRSQRSHEQQGREMPAGFTAAETVPIGTAITTDCPELEKVPTVADEEAAESVRGSASSERSIIVAEGRAEERAKERVQGYRGLWP
ncbi:Sphingoid long-chain base transporter RSB1 [Cyphellophora attinorum]|uniref:Sphingoid long-chain base transporter RSB1 n=1 Tax=Cyphellophora attinorum TaxID=1664694 RepID=A0A0N0NQ90_9EURO|nr:Sphingoid long-chain base transporter RSB1 [Phialophora attinorum]KPI43631.1 Sphingoid long-chain base transporter RSB1 [Phialophora attinorum]